MPSILKKIVPLRRYFINHSPKKETTMNGNYPIGAISDPNAPYNQIEKEMRFSVCASYTLVAEEEITATVPVEYDEYEREYCPLTADIDWQEEFQSEVFTPMELIDLLREAYERERADLMNNPHENARLIRHYDAVLRSCKAYSCGECNVEQL